MLVGHFRECVVRPAISYLGIRYASKAAENLLVGTALVESNLVALDQIGGGPALGFFQIEEATHADVWANFLAHRMELRLRVEALLAKWPTPTEQLRTNLIYAAAIARLIYFRANPPLPEPEDIDGLAMYWKAHYNSPLGKGQPGEFVARYLKHHPAKETVA